MRPLDERQEADRGTAPARSHVREHVAQEVHRGRLPEGQHLGGQLRRHRLAVMLLVETKADVAAARPPLLVVDPDVLGNRPVRLVPEDAVRSRLDSRVRPLAAVGTVDLVVEAAGGDAATVVEDLARLRTHRHEAALRLAAERPAEAPRRHLHCEAELMRRGNDLGHRPAVVGEVVLREGVENVGVPARGDVLEIAPVVAKDAGAEVGAAGPRGHAPSPGAPAANSTETGCSSRPRRCESSATSR